MQNLATLKKYFLKYRTTLVLGFLFILLSNLGTVYIPILIKDAVNELQSAPRYDNLSRYAWIIIVTSFIAGVFRFLIRETIIVVSREIEYDLRGDFWGHIQKLPLRYFQNNSTGNLMAHATSDINAVRMFIGPAVMYSTDTFVRLVITVILMFNISAAVTFYALIPLPLLSFAVYQVGKKIHKRFTKIQEKFSELTVRAQENFSGIRVIKSYGLEESEIKSFNNLSEEYLQKNMALVRIQALFQPVLFLVTGFSIIIVIWAGGVKVINGDLLLGDVTALVIYLGILIWPMIAVGWVINIIQQAEASMKRLNKIFGESYEIEDNGETDTTITAVAGKIEFKNVSFRYAENLPEVLKNINLTIEQGQTAAVMGATGSGKTTLIHLLSRMYDVTGGEVLIDGKNIKTIPLHILRKHTGIVPQETFLFSDSIRNNLAYGVDDIQDEKLFAAAHTARFDKDVEDFPLGYNTMVGERGITLSGGQKQRAALTRALATDPAILVLDDSFSAVDTHTEEEILTNLKGFMKNRTSIIISHRVSTVKEADMIFVLADGTIAEAGRHEELINLNGLYADIYNKQLLEKELEEL